MNREIKKILDEAELAIGDLLEISKDNMHFTRLRQGLRDAYAGVRYARESIDGQHDNFIPGEDEDVMNEFIYECTDSEYHHLYDDLTHKELLEEYEGLVDDDDLDAQNRIARLTSIYNGMRLLKVVNE